MEKENAVLNITFEFALQVIVYCERLEADK
jgi:hypothetical protein